MLDYGSDWICSKQLCFENFRSLYSDVLKLSTEKKKKKISSVLNSFGGMKSIIDQNIIASLVAHLTVSACIL